MSQTLVLASGSPRRRDLLRAHGYRPVLRVPEVDETPRPGEPAVALALRLARSKAEAVPGRLGELVLAADTLVHRGHLVLGKPSGDAEARAMLTELSDGWHDVTTAFCVRGDGRSHAQAVTTRVRFRALEPALVDGYVATGEPLDKAGAYGIQGRGAGLVAEIAGSYTNVVGLPLAEVVVALAALGLPDPLQERP